MAFPASFIDEVVARNPIEDVVGQHVNLRRSGANLFGLCPFHGEKTASFSVAPDKGSNYVSDASPKTGDSLPMKAIALLVASLGMLCALAADRVLKRRHRLQD